jgi:hypothetical protein
VTAGEQELEPLIWDRRLVHLDLRRLGNVQQPRLLQPGSVAPDTIDRPVARGGDKPRARIVGSARARPPLGGDRERLLSGLLGEVEVAEEADQRGEDAPPLVAEDPFEDR